VCRYGELIVSVTVKKEHAKKEIQRVKFKKFLREYEYEDWYLASIMPREMMHEFAVSRCRLSVKMVNRNLYCM
jgi:hypothetical protein